MFFRVSGLEARKSRVRGSAKATATQTAMVKTATHTNWHKLVFQGELASIAESYDTSDSIEGSIQQRKITPRMAVRGLCTGSSCAPAS